MAIVKHIKSRNANYSDALNYLIFQHDESTGKMILDEFNRPLRRDELYVDGLNCNPDTFDVECYECNEHFKKNRNRSEIKSHHYIISYDPADAIECDLTGEKAQALSLELAKKIFPGYQALIVTHTDGHNGSGNIHTQTELKDAFSESQKQLDQATKQLMEMNADLKNINSQIHYTGQYFAQKAIYTEFLKAKNKGRFRKEHTAEIQAYEEARDWLKSFYPDGKMLPIKTLKEQKASLQEQIDQQKSSIRFLKDLTQDLRTVDKNVEAILHNQVPKKQKTREPEL